MTDEGDRTPEAPNTPDGYFNVPEGKGNVTFLNEDGIPLTAEQWEARIQRRAGESTRPGLTRPTASPQPPVFVCPCRLRGAGRRGAQLL